MENDRDRSFRSWEFRTLFLPRFVDGTVDAAKGKGHAEARAIRRALDSGILDGCERVVKVTGRYFLEGLDAALAYLLDDCGLDAQYELVVSADVLCYFGDLKGVLSALAAKTAPGGDLIFTVETCVEINQGFR